MTRGRYNYPVDSWASTFTDLRWLYDEVSALFPSIYLYSHDAAANVKRVDQALNRTQQVRDDLRKRLGRVLPTYTFAWLDYDMPPFPRATAGLLTVTDMRAELVRGATRWGLAGTILWASSVDSRNTTLCGGGPASLSAYVSDVAGPALLAAAEAADACAASRCSSHGRCRGDEGASGACECDEGRSGAACESKVKA